MGCPNLLEQSDMTFPHKWGKADYIPENIFYRLAMKAKNEAALPDGNNASQLYHSREGNTMKNSYTTATDERKELNNMLALLAKQGNGTALAQLWEVNRPIIRRMFWQWYDRNQSIAEAAGLTIEDFEQEGFFAVQRAAEYHDPEKGSFLTVLQYFVQKQIRSATCKGRGQYITTEDGRKIRISAEPMNTAISLDEPLTAENGDDVGTRGDIVPDPAATQAFNDAEQSYYLQELRAVLDKALSLLSERQRTIIARRFFEGLTLKQIGQYESITAERVRSVEAEALRLLRNNTQLRKFYGEDLLARSYRFTGFTTWSQYGSVPERLAERKEEQQKRLEASSTKHLAKLLGMDANELTSIMSIC